MYNQLPKLQQPVDENIRVWRYMDFTKFMSLLDSKTLYFTRPDKFEDPFEGSYPQLSVEARKSFFEQTMPKVNAHKIDDSLVKASKIKQMLAKSIAINCWHMNNHESTAMWKLYLNSNEGIAIQSTYYGFNYAIFKIYPYFFSIGGCFTLLSFLDSASLQRFRL